MKTQFAMALPKHVTPDRLLRVVMTAVQNTPKLLECDRTSLFSAVMTCAQLGLEPDGVLGQAYLVPFKGKVVFIPGYKGLLTLARNSGEISSIQAHEVCENDEFDFAYGLDERLQHKPAHGERGEIIYFYAYAKYKDGGHVFEVLTRADVEKIRDGSEGYKAFKAGYTKTTPWNDHFVQMGRKTAIRRLANYLPRSVQKATAFEDAYDRGVPAISNELGEIVLIEDQSGETTDEPAAEVKRTKATKSKMDMLAAGPVEEITTPMPAEPVDEITDPETGELVPVAAAAPAPKPKPVDDEMPAFLRRTKEPVKAPAPADDDWFPGDAR
jgi:recombination protein RecT